ncbi:hypothetical protein BpHYR1_024660 [Brachionus plicatilis]|uniref:Uncharacterized protein n=1 Tax=Brachionus plicatilis TaxID=10195 RepID=A0A3M7R158_BRAPC|nr:hypothetical protein BpHYR1_024660 [Brachionus plicatilis]
MVGTNCLNRMLELIATIAFKLRNPSTKLEISRRKSIWNIDFEKWKLKQLLDKDKKKVLNIKWFK